MILDWYANPDLNLQFETDQKTKGKTLRGKPFTESNYQPSEAVRLATVQDQKDFWYARMVQQNPYAEFNDTSLLIRLQKDQKVFNAWTPPPSDDPDLSWMSDAYRPIARNKVISVAAHLTRALIFPEIVALDKDSQEDKDAAEVMRDLMEWSAEQSNYVKTFLYAVIDAAVLPAAIVHHEYRKVYRKQKTIQPDGTWKEEMVVDELFSGFKDTLLGSDELFIADAFIEDIQQQPYIMWRRAIEYDTAYAKYHSSKLDENGKVIPNAFDLYVEPGIQLLFDAQTVLFYRQYDENLRGKLVEEVHVWRRAQDIHRIYVNGVLITDPDQPNQRIDKLYPFAKGGYEPFNHRFFWYCSLIKKLSRDEEVVNTMYRMVMDEGFLKLKRPMFVMGEESITGEVIVPGNVIPLKSDTKVQPYDTAGDLKSGLELIQKLEDSISESAASGDVQSGQTAPGQQTAQEIATVEENARVLLGLFAKMISFLVKDWGNLIIGDIIQYLTVGEADEMLNDEAKLKFNKFLVHKSVNGKKKARRIVFEPNLPSIVKGMPKDKKDRYLHFDAMKDEGYSIKDGQLEDGDKEIAFVDPGAFRKLKFMTKVRPEALTPPSEVVEKALNLELYDRAIANPLTNQEEALRTFLYGSYAVSRDNADKYIQKQQPQGPMAMQPQGQPQQGGAKGIMQNAMGAKRMMQNPQGAMALH